MSMAMNNDITFCLNDNCPVKHQCRRGQQPTKSPVSVSYFSYTPTINHSVICSGWWKIESEQNRERSRKQKSVFSEFDKFIASLEENQETAKQLSEARKWVADSFYVHMIEAEE